MTKKFFVVGNNSSKSLSPTIFNYWFKKYKIHAKYGHIQLNNKNFDKRLKKLLLNKNVKGLNITIPFKKKIIKYIDVCDKHSNSINAVNCVTIKSKIFGTNTDWLGYYRTLPKNHKLKDKKVIIIGYGGAALSIHYVLKNKGFKNIEIYNRSKKKLRYEKKTKFTKKLSQLPRNIQSAGLIINTTPSNPIQKENIDLVDKKTILSDIVYRPKDTNFLKNFPENKKIYGISMLVEQAKPCFKKWFGFEPIADKELFNILDKKIK